MAPWRVLLYSPRVLLLDDPLPSPDERLRQRTLQLLRRVEEEARIPMIYVTPARAEIDYLADSVWRMEQGRLSTEDEAPEA